MFSKTITYEDLNGETQSEVLYFHMSKIELVDMRFEMGDDFEDLIKRIVATEDHGQLIKIFKDLLLRSYGTKSADGRRFIKSDQLREEALQSEAFSELFMALATDSDEAIRFINALVPKGGKGNLLQTANVVEPAEDVKLNTPSEKDLQSMTIEELRALVTGTSNL